MFTITLLFFTYIGPGILKGFIWTCGKWKCKHISLDNVTRFTEFNCAENVTMYR